MLIRGGRVLKAERREKSRRFVGMAGWLSGEGIPHRSTGAVHQWALAEGRSGAACQPGGRSLMSMPESFLASMGALRPRFSAGRLLELPRGMAMTPVRASSTMP